MKKNLYHPAFLLRLALSLSLAAVFPVLAQTPPDAGQMLRELREPTAPASRPAAPTLTIDPGKDGEAANGTRFHVSAIRVTGSKRFATAELEALVADMAGAVRSLADLQLAAQRITAHYRAHGYAVARAYLPAQEIRDGVVRIAVLEGSLGKHVLDNRSRLADKQLDATIAATIPPGGDPIETARADRALLLLGDLPGVGRVAGVLKPGDRVGTSDLSVTVEPGKPFEGEIALDNYGNRFVGQNRVSGRLDVNSPLRLGDRLLLQATASDEKLAYGRIAWDAPVGHDGLRAGVASTASRYELAEDFASLKAHGTAETTSLYASYPALRGPRRNLWLGANLERRRLDDRIDSTATTTDKTANVLALEAFGDSVDGFAGGGANRWRLAATSGDLSIDTPSDLAIDQASARTNGSYRKWLASFSRLQALVGDISLYFSATGQWAGKNLDSSEKFVLGGAYSIRAYPQGEAAGDEGWLATAELRHRLSRYLQWSLFYDAGGIDINRKPFAAGANSRHLSGYGIGLAANWGGLTVKADVAWRGDEAPTSDRDRQPRTWAMAGWRF